MFGPSFNQTVLVNGSDNGGQDGETVPLLRQPLHLLVVSCVAYGLVFVLGLVGNVFVVMAVALNMNMRSITNYFITSLAVADLLIIIFSLPATLMNNIFYEWWLGNVMCKVSTWTSGATVCTSVYTLVAVSADRYFALCHTMRYSVIRKSHTFMVIFPIWIASGILFSPWLIYFHESKFNVSNGTYATVCTPKFPGEDDERLFFLFINVLVAFFIPLVAIIIFYVCIYWTFVSRHPLAVDKHAHERESRTKMKITKMMLVVVVLFAVSWAPLYILYLDVYFSNYIDVNGELFSVMRSLSQWLSLANSCINPVTYAYFSRRFRRAFQEILVMPCRKRYQQFKSYTTTKSRRLLTSVREKRPSAFKLDGGSRRPSSQPDGASSTQYSVLNDKSLRRHSSTGRHLGVGRRRSAGFRRRVLESAADDQSDNRRSTIEETTLRELVDDACPTTVDDASSAAPDAALDVERLTHHR